MFIHLLPDTALRFHNLRAMDHLNDSFNLGQSDQNRRSESSLRPLIRRDSERQLLQQFPPKRTRSAVASAIPVISP
jgi:hypothetical protein